MKVLTFQIRHLFGCCAGQSTGWRTNKWVANPLGPGQTSALQIKTRSAKSFNVYL